MLPQGKLEQCQNAGTCAVLIECQPRSRSTGVHRPLRMDRLDGPLLVLVAKWQSWQILATRKRQLLRSALRGNHAQAVVRRFTSISACNSLRRTVNIVRADRTLTGASRTGTRTGSPERVGFLWPVKSCSVLSAIAQNWLQNTLQFLLKLAAILPRINRRTYPQVWRHVR